MSGPERRALVERLGRDEQVEMLKLMTADALIAIGRRSIVELGPAYRYRLVKSERVKGEMFGPQTSRVVMREQPFSVRMDYLAGPGKGRKLLYNPKLREKDMRVREGGLLGIAALWISMDGSLAKRESNHKITEMGFARLLDQYERDFKLAAKHGGLVRKDEGFDARGAYCLLFSAPKPGTGMYADVSRICMDLKVGLPVMTELFDGKGQMMERYEMSDIGPAPEAAGDDYYSLEAAGL